MAIQHASSTTAPTTGVTVIATDRGWHGSRTDLARLLSARFGLEAHAVTAALEANGRVEVAFSVSTKDAESLREVLERIGVTALFETPPPSSEPDDPRAPPESADTVLDRAGHSKVMAPPRPRNTMAGGWAKRRDTPQPEAQAPIGLTGLSVGAGLAVNNPEPLRPRPDNAPTTVDLPLGLRVAFDDHPESPGLDAEFSDAWERLLGGADLGEPEPEDLPTLEQFEPATLVSQSLPDEVAPPREAALPGEAALPSAGGWAAVLGDKAPERPSAAPKPMPMPTPSSPPSPKAYDRTEQWEITIESSDSAKDEDPEDLFNTQVNDVSHLMAGVASAKASGEIPELPPLQAPPGLATPSPPIGLPRPAPLRRGSDDFSALDAVAAPRLNNINNNDSEAADHSPTRALILSLLIPGAGQIYNGQIGKGIGIGLTFWLVAPWIDGAIDALSTAKAITEGKKRSKGPSATAHALLYAALFVPAAIALAFGLSGALGGPDVPAPPDAAQSRDNLIKARGEVAIGLEKALYQAQRAIEDSAPCTPGKDCPDDPCHKLSEKQCEIRARQLFQSARNACGGQRWGECKTLSEQAKLLDRNNREIWKLILQSTQAIAAPPLSDSP